MIYKEYLAKGLGDEALWNPYKKLGILGEMHLYTETESEFAREMVEGYNVVGVEGTSRPDMLDKIIGLLYKPFCRAYGEVTGRSKNYTALKWAKELGKKIIRLEDGVKRFSLSQKLTQLNISLNSFLLSPFIPLLFKEHPELIEEIEKLNDPYSDYAANLEGRNKIMAEKSIEILKKGENKDLLIVCGEAHVPGILDILYDKMVLEKVEEIRVDPITSL